MDNRIKITKENANQIASQLGVNKVLEANGLPKLGEVSKEQLNIAEFRNANLENQIVTDLGKKMVYQEISGNSSTDYFSESITPFKDEIIESGTGKQFVKPYFMDSGFYDRTNYIPTDARLTEGKFASQNIEFKQTDAITGANGSYAFQSTVSWLPGEIKQAMVSPVKLAEVLEKIRQITIESFRLRQFHALMNTITNQTYAKTITSTATNMFDAVIELAEHTRIMTRGSDDYNLLAAPSGFNKMLNVVQPDDLIIIGNVKFFNKVNRAVSPQLFHPDSWNKTVNELGRQIEVGTKLTINNTFNTTIQSGNSMYVADTDLYVLDANAFRINNIYSYEVSAQWINGVMTMTSSIWFTINPIWFQSGFKFTCANLLKLPTN